MEPYIHHVQYYETDKMGITHHSNYIRWMEEARVDFLSQIGWDFARLEEMGLISPVIGVDAKYKESTKFADDVSIVVSVLEYKGVRLKLGYEMTRSDGKLVCQAHSEHCFLNTAGRPVRMASEFPEFHESILAQVKKSEE